MANTFEADLITTNRQGGAEGKSYLVIVGTLIIDTPASAFPASLFGLFDIQSVQPISNDDDTDYWNATVNFDSLGIVTRDKATGAADNLDAATAGHSAYCVEKLSS